MRITVGGLLLVLGAGAGGVWVATRSTETDVVKGLQDKVNTSLGLFKSASETVTPLPAPQDQPSALPEISPAEPIANENLTPPAEPEAIPEIIPTPTPESVAPVQPASRPRSRRRRSKGTATTARKTPRADSASTAPIKSVAKDVAREKKPVRSTPKESLVGTYVVLTLTTGREVKGILKEQSPSIYKVELPGLGEFNYPAQNIKSINPVE